MNTFLLLLIGIPIIEIYLFIKLGSQIGAFNTILLIFITAFFGIIYARYEGFNTLKSGMSQMVKNELPVYEIISGAALAFAALLLILPGFATDFLGLSCAPVPPLRGTGASTFFETRDGFCDFPDTEFGEGEGGVTTGTGALVDAARFAATGAGAFLTTAFAALTAGAAFGAGVFLTTTFVFARLFVPDDACDARSSAISVPSRRAEMADAL